MNIQKDVNEKLNVLKEVYGENNKAMFDGFADQFYILKEENEELNGNDD